jgi:trimeric autotransporter adhesin
VNLEVGSGRSHRLLGIDWSAGPYFLEISVDGTSMGTTQLLSVPYALYAASAPSSELGENSVNSTHIIDGSITDIGTDAVR